MFVYNLKLNNGLLKKLLICGLVVVLIVVFIVVGFKFYNASSRFVVNDSVNESRLDVNCNNYTSILKDSHENIDKYVGKEIKFTGFVYRLFDFTENQFVLSREMIISSDNQAVIVGFLCDCDTSSNFRDGCWVEIEGVIEKGNYHGDIPIVKIKNIKETNAPKDEFVYPPDMSYVN